MAIHVLLFSGPFQNIAQPPPVMDRELQPVGFVEQRQDGLVPVDVPLNDQCWDRVAPAQVQFDDQCQDGLVPDEVQFDDHRRTERFQTGFHWMVNAGTEWFQLRMPFSRRANSKRCHPDNIYQADGVAEKTTRDKKPTPDETGGKTPPTESDKSVSQVLGNAAQNLCPMLCPLAGQRAQTIRSLITWVNFFLWRWYIANNVSNNALETLFKLFCQVISIAGAREISGVVSEAFPTTMFRFRKWFGMEHADDFQRLVCCDKCYSLSR